MEQFSHDLTLALEETSRIRAGHCWGVRRRTRSTGNLPCAPQPTEDSSSPGEGPNEINECQSNSILSDSDDRQNFQLALKVRQTCLFGNFESDSLNENFSPTRPNTRRKRKFKRIAVEYETTPSTPGNTNPTTPIFPSTASAVKKRVLKHTSQENFRAGLFFCGKRKRSHRDRYHDYEHYRLHSSSVPRQREFYTPKNSYLEYKNRNRGAYAKPCERILPLNKSIVSKIEKISQDSNNIGNTIGFNINRTDDEKHVLTGFSFTSTCLPNSSTSTAQLPAFKPQLPAETSVSAALPVMIQAKSPSMHSSSSTTSNKLSKKSGSFELPFKATDTNQTYLPQTIVPDGIASIKSKSSNKDGSRKSHHTSLHPNHKRKESRRRSRMKMQIQFDDANGMDCGNLNDFLSSSSLSSSSDSEAGLTNESDREGDDELTDWPGNEAMINFASKNDFKRANKRTNGININNPLLGSSAKPTIQHGRFLNDDNMGQDEDTLMSADELISVSPKISHFNVATTTIANTSQNPICIPPPTTLVPASLTLPIKFAPSLTSAQHTLTSSITNTPIIGENHLRHTSSLPIDISPQAQPHFDGHLQQIESEMSGESSNHFLSNTEVREIRAGCRRIRDERPGFTIFTKVNEHLSRFLQDSRQTQLILPYTDNEENGKLIDLAKLYSLKMEIENGRAIFYKTINTTQAVKIDQTNISKLFLSDYKRRCYNVDDDSESTEMAS